MITARLAKTLKIFEVLGKMTAKNMKGGFGIFCDGTNFALVVGDTLHILSTSFTEGYFKSMGFKVYPDQSPENQNDPRYYALPEIMWEDTQEILSIGFVALKYAKIKQQEDREQESTKIEVKETQKSSSIPKPLFEKSEVACFEVRADHPEPTDSYNKAKNHIKNEPITYGHN